MRTDRLCDCVNHHDFIRFGNIRKDAMVLRIDLQRFRMSRHGKIGDESEAVRIYNGDPCRIGRVRPSVPYKKKMMSLVIDHVVGIVGEFDRTSQSERRPAVNSQFTERTICNIQTAGLRNPSQAVRLAQSRDALLDLVRPQINHFNRMIGRRRDEQAIARRVDSQVVEPSGHAGKRNCPAQRERSR